MALAITVGNSQTLTPSGEDPLDFEYSSSALTVVSVDASGVVSALAPGIACIQIKRKSDGETRVVAFKVKTPGFAVLVDGRPYEGASSSFVDPESEAPPPSYDSLYAPDVYLSGEPRYVASEGLWKYELDVINYPFQIGDRVKLHEFGTEAEVTGELQVPDSAAATRGFRLVFGLQPGGGAKAVVLRVLRGVSQSQPSNVLSLPASPSPLSIVASVLSRTVSVRWYYAGEAAPFDVQVLDPFGAIVASSAGQLKTSFVESLELPNGLVAGSYMARVRLSGSAVWSYGAAFGYVPPFVPATFSIQEATASSVKVSWKDLDISTPVGGHPPTKVRVKLLGPSGYAFDLPLAASGATTINFAAAPLSAGEHTMSVLTVSQASGATYEGFEQANVKFSLAQAPVLAALSVDVSQPEQALVSWSKVDIASPVNGYAPTHLKLTASDGTSIKYALASTGSHAFALRPGNYTFSMRTLAAVKDFNTGMIAEHQGPEQATATGQVRSKATLVMTAVSPGHATVTWSGLDHLTMVDGKVPTGIQIYDTAGRFSETLSVNGNAPSGSRAMELPAGTYVVKIRTFAAGDGVFHFGNDQASASGTVEATRSNAVTMVAGESLPLGSALVTWVSSEDAMATYEVRVVDAWGMHVGNSGLAMSVVQSGYAHEVAYPMFGAMPGVSYYVEVKTTGGTSWTRSSDPFAYAA